MVSSAKSEMVLCAPFAKRHIMERLLNCRQGSPSIQVITRWRPEEVAAGVSDPSVLNLISSEGGSVWLNDQIHAKYFRCDDEILLGSANLTGAALGWSRRSNVEVAETARWTKDAQGFEELLLAGSTLATPEFALEIEDLASKLPSPLFLEGEPEVPSVWWPHLREPKDLWVAYCGGREKLTSISAVASDADLLALDLPMGLGKSEFSMVVATRLRQHHNIDSIDHFLESPRRFGEVRDQISRISGKSREDSTHIWQTLMRWLMEFLPRRYEVTVPRHSEVIKRVDG